MEIHLRWKYRFANFKNALDKLLEAVNYIKLLELENEDYTGQRRDPIMIEIVKEGLIQRFEYTHELAWNVMKDFAVYQGNSNVGGSSDATREAFQMQLISDGRVWMDMIGSRNKTSHTYIEDTANERYYKIMNDYHPAFVEFKRAMEDKLADAKVI